MASDDQSELWLSTDESPANIVKIAYLGTLESGEGEVVSDRERQWEIGRERERERERERNSEEGEMGEGNREERARERGKWQLTTGLF